jgi:hypothetical protein
MLILSFLTISFPPFSVAPDALGLNPANRVTDELTAPVGARVMGEHRHPALVEQFTVLEGALSIY